MAMDPRLLAGSPAIVVGKSARANDASRTHAMPQGNMNRLAVPIRVETGPDQFLKFS
jgi:hypothetical protein